MNERFSYIIMFSILLAIVILEPRCKKDIYKRLHTKQLTVHTEGEIYKVTGVKYSTKLVKYLYTYKVEGEIISGSYKMEPKYEGIIPGSPVGVIYLKKDPHTSRLIWTAEDFKWLE